MRVLGIAAVAAILLGLAPAASAGPTCLNVTGVTARCGTPGAMPVGWTPPPEDVQGRQMSEAADLSPRDWFNLACVLGGLLGIILLMPNFDSSQPGAWDRQEGDETERR